MIIPRGYIHLLSGWFTGLFVAYVFDLPASLIYIHLLGTLWPDVDTKQSWIGKWIPLWLIFKPHRYNMTHSIMGACVFSVWWLYASLEACLMFLSGYLLHLVLDMLTPMGVPLYYPKKDRIRLFERGDE